MKTIFFLLISLLVFLNTKAAHITGGEVIYEYLRPGTNGGKVYQITLRLFRDNNCPTPCAAMPPSVSLGIFNNDNNQQIDNYQQITLNQNQVQVGVVASPSCLTNAPMFNYGYGIYSFEKELPANIKGYTITYQTCCRVDGIENLGSSRSVGATYIGTIPGSETLPIGIDNSPIFEAGISIICQNNKFILDFSATDKDGDNLVYSFVDAFDGGAARDAGYATPVPPPYGGVPYSNLYSGTSPLGNQATINPATGIISGIAPAAGKYVVSVNVQSFRNGIFIENHRKDFIVTVAPCDFANADLRTSYINCDDFTVDFVNLSNSPLNLTFEWDFGEPSSGANNTSTEETPSHTYSTAGDYVLRLIVNKNSPCVDTAFSIVKVYPGFAPAFAPIPSQCKNTAVQFNDATTAAFGAPSYWRWDFGVQNLTNDTSLLKSPTYSYAAAGRYIGEFIVETNRGCRDTLYPEITIVDKPAFFVTNDTLICVIDTLQLRSNVAEGSIRWTPNYMISDVNSFNPLVSPDVTTTYIAFYQDRFGCSTSDTVTVNVVSEVTLLNGRDTTICRTDSARLTLNTDAIYFDWKPANVIIDSTVKNPIVFPNAASTDFIVRASISEKCFKNDTINVRTVPYPTVNITGDSVICYGTDVQLNASGGSGYLWTPSSYLNNARIPNPIAQFPKVSLTYRVAVTDTLGCPKPSFKTIPINVVRIIANAGPADTSVVLNQPLQLNATGSTIYTWAPPTYLNNPNIFNPISLPTNNITYTVTASNEIGCNDTDTINVKVFFLPPDIYLPTAFTPTGDGLNDIFKPITLGIKSIENFSVYNRLGELIYTTNKIGSGWDGRYKGNLQESATFVWQANATDYQDKKIYKKGTVILIR